MEYNGFKKKVTLIGHALFIYGAYVTLSSKWPCRGYYYPMYTGNHTGKGDFLQGNKLTIGAEIQTYVFWHPQLWIFLICSSSQTFYMSELPKKFFFLFCVCLLVFQQ